MKIVREFFKYILIFISIIAVLLIIFVFVASIPKKYVIKNLKEGLNFFKKYHMSVIYIDKILANTWLFPYDDQIYFNIIYCMNEDKPLESVMEAKYYTRSEENGGNGKYIELLEKELEPNHYYLRYWHGPIIFIKLFLMVMTIKQMYILNIIILSVLLIALFVILIKNKYWSILISLIIGLIMTTSWLAPFTLIYATIYALMLVVCIISIIMENKKFEYNKFYKFFFAVGIITCFFDFLTMELLTILVPLSMILAIRIQKNYFFEFKKEFIFVVKVLALWLLGYGITYLAKWFLASIILDINVIDYIKNAALKRVNGSVSVYSTTELVLRSLKRNFRTLFPITEILMTGFDFTIPILFTLIFLIVLLDIKNKNKRSFLILMLMIAVIPYCRYIVLSNHSYLHYFFTFRNQMGTVMCIVFIILNCLNNKKLFVKVEFKNTKYKQIRMENNKEIYKREIEKIVNI